MGGDFPFLAYADDVNLHIQAISHPSNPEHTASSHRIPWQVHLRHVGCEPVRLPPEPQPQPPVFVNLCITMVLVTAEDT